LVERVIAQQLALMQQQLELLRTGSESTTATPAAPVMVASSLPVPSTTLATPAPCSRAAAHGGDGDLKRFGPFKGIEIGPKGGLTPKQEKALAELTARYNRRTAGSKAYAQNYRSHFCDPRAAGNFRQQWKEMVYPIVCVRSKGGKIWDIDGNEYVDVTLGFGANYFGHSPDFVVKAVEEQLHKGFEIGPQSPLAGEVAQMLCAMTGMERATFCNTGSEAVMAAMRVARTVTARDKIVYFTGDYHGIFDEVLAHAGIVDGLNGALPVAPGIPPLPNMIVLEYGSPASLDVIRARANEIAAVMVEPVQSRHPDLQPREFLQALRQVTRETDIALIFDEVVTGFRAALGGAQEYFGVRADLATYGKVVGGGMPIGVLAGTRQFMDALDGGMWEFGDASYPEVGVTFFAGTFVRHPLAMAAAHATLKYLQQAGPDLQQQTTEKTALFARRLNDYFASVGVPIRLQAFSSVFYYDFHPDLKYANLLFYYLRDCGVHIWEGRVGQVCTAHTEEELNLVFDAFKAAVEEMQAGGFLPTRDGAGSVAAPAKEAIRSSGPVRAPLTEAQREIWIAAQMGEDANCAYNESCSVHLHGNLDVDKFQQALQQFINRHDALRCRFSPTGDYQEFAPEVTVELPVRELAGLSSGQRERQVEAIISSDMAMPFDLVNGPVFRVRLLKQADDHHQFIFTTHHAVCDGWSFGVVFHELAQLYSALVEGKPCTMEPAMQFSEYAEWSRRQQDTPEFKEAEQFWIRKFAGTTIPALDLPYDRPRPPFKTYNGSLAVRRCDPQVFRDLKKTSGKMGNTVFATLFSAFYALLHRLSGQDDIVIGIAAAGQTMVGSNDLLGHCLNFLPTRSGIDGEQPFAEFTGRIRKDVLDAYDHQTYTYGTLIRKLKLTHDASRLPLLSVMFNIDKRGMDKLNFAGLKATVATNPKKYVNFDLFVNLVQGDNELDLECEFNTDLFDRETVLRWLGHFESLMRAIAANPRCPLGALPLLDPTERSMVLNHWNQTSREYPKDRTLHALFEAQAANAPDAVAVIHDTQRIKYAELNRRANYFARLLREAGARPDAFVALCVERNLDLLVGVLAILKAGAAYVPMDPMYPQERLAFYLQDSQATLLLTQRKLVASLPPHQAKAICLDDPIPDGPVPNPETTATQTNIAYVIYTSGSTGKPKGVAIEHRNAVNFVHWALGAFTDAEMAGVLASTSICFDLSIYEIFVTLSRGGKIILAENALHLPRLAARDQVTLINTVPSATAELVQAGALPHSVQVVNLAGEALPTSLVNQIYALKHVNKVHDLYGPTETTTYSTWTLRRKGEPPTIGRPIGNTRIYIVDRKAQPTPVGVPGELLIGGAGVARGYLNRPELTAEKFIPDPFSSEASARVYRTGDLARYHADGNIEFLGRIDHQVKFRGFRIELGEIEALLRTHPAVLDSVMLVREDTPGQKRLVAYVTRQAGENESPLDLPGTLTAFLQPKLPDYMVPSVVVVLETLPRTPNGKVDRKALPTPSAEAKAASHDFVAPRNDKEKALADIWLQVLGLKEVSVLDNFFELGGDSLLSFRVANRANQVGLPLTPRLFFQHGTIAELVKAAEREEVAQAKPATSAIARIDRSTARRRR
jgi:amino acid adenylation domain-containing protein